MGNKCDLKDGKKVKEEDIKDFCEKNNIPYYETSAKDNINIDKAFMKACELMHEKLLKEETEFISEPKNLVISHRAKKSCCS